MLPKWGKYNLHLHVSNMFQVNDFFQNAMPLFNTFYCHFSAAYCSATTCLSLSNLCRHFPYQEETCPLSMIFHKRSPLSCHFTFSLVRAVSQQLLIGIYQNFIGSLTFDELFILATCFSSDKFTLRQVSSAVWWL